MKLSYHYSFIFISLLLFSFSTNISCETESPAYSPISPEPVSSPAPQPISSPVSSPAPQPSPSFATIKDSTPDHASDPASLDDGIFDAISELPLSAENLPPVTTLTEMLKDSPLGNLVTSVKTQTDVDPELKKICDETDYPPLCISMVSSNLPEKIDTKTVFESSITASSEHVKHAIDATNKILGKYDPGSSTAFMLRDCRDNFHDTMDNLQKALDAMSTLDMGTINSMLSTMVQDMSQCIDGVGGEYFPLADSCRELTKMASNCVALAALLK